MAAPIPKIILEDIGDHVHLQFTRKLYRQWSSFIALMWFALSTFLLEHWAKVRVVMTGDSIPSAESAIIICNHRTRIDWMFLWCLCLRLGILESMKIALKESLKSLPGFGWAMQAMYGILGQCFMFVFLARDKSKDLKYMEDVLNYHKKNKHPLSLVLFPEGTDLHPAAVTKSNTFAAQKGLPKYKYVLHPKVGGWVHCVANLRGTCKAVYDVTVGYHDYTDNERPSEISLLSGRFPKEVHLHVERHEVTSLPESTTDLEQWLEKSFVKKEQTLKDFYTGPKSFPGPKFQPPVSPAQMHKLWMEALVFWGVASAVTGASLVLIVGWFFMIAMILFWYFVTRAGGVDLLELRLHGPNGIRLWPYNSGRGGKLA